MKKIRLFFKKIILWILRIEAKIQLYKFKPKIIGIGGSSGKSSVSNFIYLILREKYNVRHSSGKNSESGIPLSILNINMKGFSSLDWFKAIILGKLRVLFDWKRFDFYVAEMGVDSPVAPGNMSYLLRIIKPDIGILTNISFEHSQNFDPLVSGEDNREERILGLTAKEELLLLTSISRNSNSIINLDDEIIAKNRTKIKSNKITVSAGKNDADFFIKKISNSIQEFSTEFIFKNKDFRITIKNPLPDHFAYSIVLSIAACYILGVKVEDSIKIIEENFKLPPGRFSIFKGIKNSLIIDSSYNNATLPPILDILDLTKKISGKRRKVAIIGDMRELGTMSEKNHKAVANKILEDIDLAILIGPLMKKFGEPILKAKKFPVESFKNFTKAKEYILNSIEQDDLILVKGSQNTLFLERVVKMLLKDPKDEKKLCRRGKFWDKQREMTL